MRYTLQEIHRNYWVLAEISPAVAVLRREQRFGTPDDVLTFTARCQAIGVAVEVYPL